MTATKVTNASTLASPGFDALFPGGNQTIHAMENPGGNGSATAIFNVYQSAAPPA